MHLVPLVLLLLACGDQDTLDDREPAGSCVVTDTRTYDEVDGYYEVDPVLGFSAEDVTLLMFGGFSGTYTPSEGDTLGVELSVGIDGEIVVVDQEWEPDQGSEDLEPPEGACPTEMRLTLLLAVSTDKSTDDTYLLDDLWSPTVAVSTLGEGTFVGSKPLSEVDGTATPDFAPEDYDQVSLRVEADFVDGDWQGSTTFVGKADGEGEEPVSTGTESTHGTFAVSPDER